MSPEQQPLSPLDPTEEALVRALGQVMMALPRTVDADMVRDGGLRLSEYGPLRLLSEGLCCVIRGSGCESVGEAFEAA
ncbi:hypothetical protein [Streptomyces sp. NPDC059909]|uniref:hypothetical protein n=1 Tax=Streptomyces sp. NPDC059909 TaxID=3346998 RepID=UPI00364881D2